jgi:hypothetical protein
MKNPRSTLGRSRATSVAMQYGRSKDPGSTLGRGERRRMAVTVDARYHSNIKDGSDRAIGFVGEKQPSPNTERLPPSKRMDIKRSLARRAPMRPVKR